MIPVAILFFGLTTKMSTFVIAFGSLWPVLLSAIHGFVKVPRELREVASTLEMSKLRYILTIATPSASVDIMAGLRISLSLALILTVVTEMQASLPGLGYEIFLAQRTFRTRRPLRRADDARHIRIPDQPGAASHGTTADALEQLLTAS